MNIDKLVLTPEQMMRSYMGSDYHPTFKLDLEVAHGVERVSLATVKKYHKWLNEDCDEHPHQVYPTGTDFTARIECPDCMRAVDKLLEEG